MGRVKPLSGRPLYANASDDRLYIRPEDVIARIDRSTERELNTLVFGERGSGKTSLLQHLLLRARADASTRHVVYVDASIAQSAVDVINLVREQLGIEPDAGESASMVLRAMREAERDDAGLLLQRLIPLGNVAPTVVLLDGLVSSEVAHILFGRLRDELWALPLTWVVTTDAERRSTFLTPPADVFFETVVELRPLSVVEQHELLERRLPQEWQLVTALVHAERGNPRQLLRQAREALVEGLSVEEVIRTHEARADLVGALGASAAALMSALESIGRPAAASDDDLLKRLGVTRERATQVLNQLEDEGLLESFTAPVERGRPRKLYRIVETRDQRLDGGQR